MITVLLWIILGLAAGAVVLLIVSMARSRQVDPAVIEKAVREELRAAREETSRSSRELREEVGKNLAANSDALAKLLGEMDNLQRTQIAGVSSQLLQFTESNRAGIEHLRGAVTDELKSIREASEKKLEEMRCTVDEKLQVTLESRLGESFKAVREQLDAVHQGLGEMRTLAAGVGDLKKVLTNVKTRGLWGEIQLGAILEQILAPEQYACNVLIKENTRDFVEFAVRLPGPRDSPDSCVWLPIDSKFPQEDYLRLMEAAEAGDQDALARAAKALNQAVMAAAAQINDKYIDPPRSTDFGVMFLPTEGLYAEIIRQPGLVEQLQQNYRVVVAGPTTLSALLSSLRIGFRTLAIEKRASEVWTVLAAVKTEFAKFGDTLDRVKKQLTTVSNTIDETGRRTRAIEKKLRQVEQLPGEEADKVLGPATEEVENNGD